MSCPIEARASLEAQVRHDLRGSGDDPEMRAVAGLVLAAAPVLVGEVPGARHWLSLSAVVASVRVHLPCVDICGPLLLGPAEGDLRCALAMVASLFAFLARYSRHPLTREGGGAVVVAREGDALTFLAPIASRWRPMIVRATESLAAKDRSDWGWRLDLPLWWRAAEACGWGVEVGEVEAGVRVTLLLDPPAP